MFRNKEEKKEFERTIADLKHTHGMELEKIDHKHALEIKEKEFELKNFKDSEILAKNQEIEKLTNRIGIVEKENEMMKKMVDINADIVDVKDVINKLIEKLPEINLSSLTVQAKSE